MDVYDGELDYNPIALQAGGKTSRIIKTGDIIGDSYRLKGLIGRGGMGYVFCAEHLIIHNDYALKMLAPDQVNELSWQRFQLEGRAIARLDHANIVKIYNMGVDHGDCPYYVMDLLTGVSLAECIADRLALSLAEIVDIFVQLAQGFGYAHARGIIHRDVKPGNIVLVDSGSRYPTAKIVDFGIAKLIHGGSASSALAVSASDTTISPVAKFGASLDQQNMTSTGEIFGSPYYMSPEQCMGNEIDQRSDIYSLGCTLFETLTGEPPFKGESALQTVLMHQQSEPPTIESRASHHASDDLEAIVAKMLAKRPVDRYQTMEQLAHDLERLRANKTVVRSGETGFRSSVDTQLSDMEERYAADKSKLALRNKIVGSLVAIVLVFVTIAGARFFMIAAKPVPKAGQTKFNAATGNIHEQAIAEKKVADPELELVQKNFNAVKIIDSSLDADGKTRTLHCPASSIGKLTWARGRLNCAGLDADSRDDAYVDGRGDVKIPAHVLVTLCLNRGNDRCVWVTPEILTKVGPHELNGLELNTENGVDAFYSDTELAAQDGRVVALLKATSGWKDFKDMQFYKVSVPDTALAALEEHANTLKTFLIQETNVRPAALKNCTFFKNLESFISSETPDLDWVLQKFKGSANLKVLDLRHCPITASGIGALKTCPNLVDIRLDQPVLDNESILALSNIKSLKKLELIGCPITPAQIPVLVKLNFIEDCHVIVGGWPVEDRQRLKSLAPNINKVAFQQFMKNRLQPRPKWQPLD